MAQLVVDLVAPDGTVFPVMNGESGYETATARLAVDATRVGANGTWKLRVQDRTHGNLAACVDNWKLTF
ncbi:proprotein convertase P-domain-containing protein [Streptomyces uncialis]|uniref:proprotein convertase P-domain-containing protein n=1 Tax=Streptomyces uncialis TaxID=1048205 RepID=UPI00382AA26D